MKLAAVVLIFLSCTGTDAPSGWLEDSGLRAVPPLEGESVRVVVIDRDGTMSSVEFHASGDLPTLRASRGWYFDTSRLPRGISAADAEADVLWSAPGGTASYLGRTNHSANIDPAIQCQQRDERSVVSFGVTGSHGGNSIVGIACLWFRGETTLELDLMLDRTAPLFPGDREAGQPGQSIAALIARLHAPSPPAVRIANSHGNNQE